MDFCYTTLFGAPFAPLVAPLLHPFLAPVCTPVLRPPFSPHFAPLLRPLTPASFRRPPLHQYVASDRLLHAIWCLSCAPFSHPLCMTLFTPRLCPFFWAPLDAPPRRHPSRLRVLRADCPNSRSWTPTVVVSSLLALYEMASQEPTAGGRQRTLRTLGSCS